DREVTVTAGGQAYNFAFGSTNGWDDVVLPDISLGAGTQSIQVEFIKGGFDFNYFDIVPTGTATTNTAPTTTGLADVSVIEGAANTDIALFDAFEDAESTDTELTYAVVGNTNAALFDAVTINAATGTLSLDYAATGTGTSDLTVSTTDPQGLSTQTTFTVTVTDPTVNTAPITSGIADVTVTEGATNTVISLFDAFDDAESADAELTYAVTNNTNAALFETLNINPVTGTLSLEYTATGTGTSDLTVTATDPEGLAVDTTFTVTVNEAPVVTSQRVEAEAYVAFVDSSAGNDGDTTQFTDDVDVYVTDDATGEFHIGKIANGESLTYSVDIATAAVYDLVLRVDNNRSSDREVTVTAGGQAYNFAFGSTNGWDDVVLPDISLGAGTQSIQVEFIKGGFDFNYFDIVPTGTATTNTAPTTTGLADVSVIEGAANTDIALFDAFEDAESTDTELTYAVVGNTNAALFDAVTIDAATGTLSLDYAATGTGTSEITISATDPEGLSVESPFTVTVMGNLPPTTTGIADVVDPISTSSRDVQLFPAFADDKDPDYSLVYELVGNTDASLFSSTSIDAATGILTLNYSGTAGISTLTVQATDTEGLSTDTNFVVNAVAPSPADGVIRINAGGADVYDPAGNLWQADTSFSGGQVFDATGRPITNADDNFRFDSIYQVQRSGTGFSYAVPVANGTYKVNLHLAELVYDTNDQRIFDVSLEGDVIFNDLDIFAKTKNAFLDGKDTARILQIEEELPAPGDVVIVEDGVLDFTFTSVLGEATIAGLEIIPATTPQVTIKPSGTATNVSEDGQTDDYEVVLTTQPTSDVTVNIAPDGQLNTSTSSLTFTPENWFMAQTVTISAVDDTQAEGIYNATISHSVTTEDPAYQGLAVPSISATISDNDQASPISFTVKSVPTLNLPTRATWGPDGRLYVSSLRGDIAAYEFDDDYNIVSTQNIETIAPLSNHEILGLAFNPFDTEPKLYVAHAHLKANGGTSFPVTEYSPYSGQVSVLSGPDFSTLTPLITGIGVSNHDHGINGLDFDNQGDLYVAVGGNTNAGIVSDAIGGLDESPFTAAVLKADITKADFNGAINYTLPDGFLDNYLAENNLTLEDFTLEDGKLFDPSDSQVFGYAANVVEGVDVSVYSSGTRNPFDILFTTQGSLYATDNGANFNAGNASTGPDTKTELGGKQFDELLLLSDGGYFGHPNRNRGRTDSRQNVFYGTNNPYEESIEDVFTEPIGLFGKNSTNGMDEYRATTFGGQLRGNILAHEYNSEVWNVDLTPDGTQVEGISDLNVINGSKVAEGLDILTGPGGAILGVDLQGDLLTIAIPDDPNATSPTAYDIFPWRAPAIGGSPFIIGGVNFDPLDTQVFLGGQEITGLGVSEQRIQGTIPDLSAQTSSVLDVKVVSGGFESVIPEAFQVLNA
ncbi:MAG: hypothetical protein GVY04_15555, partial [Cyanobacteria bacterium]|nr:hypothetical protein [Cyanobacteria bacterium GSL.Bin1]